MVRVKETYPVIGISCASCVKKIEDVLNKTDGVIGANVNFATEKLTIEYDNDRLDIKKIDKIVKSIGFELIT